MKGCEKRKGKGKGNSKGKGKKGKNNIKGKGKGGKKGKVQGKFNNKWTKWKPKSHLWAGKGYSFYNQEYEGTAKKRSRSSDATGKEYWVQAADAQ